MTDGSFDPLVHDASGEPLDTDNPYFGSLLDQLIEILDVWAPVEDAIVSAIGLAHLCDALPLREYLIGRLEMEREWMTRIGHLQRPPAAED